MEEANPLILQGCKLAKDLESFLTNLHGQPDPVLLSKVCDDIIRTFTAAKERLMAGSQMEPSLQDWVRANISSPSAVDAWLQTQLMAKGDIGAGSTSSSSSSLLPVERGDSLNVNTAGRASSSLRPRSSRRKEDARTVRVAAPVMGNIEVPPDDGFTWRKYGQKEILASRFPRAYYRCTHQKLYNCAAKKQVQRLDDDPSTFEITYCGEHTCHKTDTAPSVQPPPPGSSSSSLHQHQHASSSSTVIGGGRSSWLEFSLAGSDHATIRSTPTTNPTPPPSSATAAAFNRDYPITDLADTMFNSGTNSSNSMEFIFTTPDIAKDD